MLDGWNQKIVIGNNIPIHSAERSELASTFGRIGGKVKNDVRFYFFYINRCFCPVSQVKFCKKSFLRYVPHKSSRQIIYPKNFITHSKKQVIDMTSYKTGRTGD